MRKKRFNDSTSGKPEWATIISDLRTRQALSQTAFGRQLHSSAMAISRWERGAQEPAAGSYIELGNLAGDPLCWYFWSRAGLRNEDFMRVMPGLRKRLSRSNAISFEIASAGSGKKSKTTSQLVGIPLLKVVAGSHGEAGDKGVLLQDAVVESMIAAPKDWCPNPSSTTCVRVRGHSMTPLIYDGYILAVDTSQNERSKLNGKIVIAWHKNKGLTVSRLHRYDHTDVLQAENKEYEPVVMSNKEQWKILAKVLWWIGKAP